MIISRANSYIFITEINVIIKKFLNLTWDWYFLLVEALPVYISSPAPWPQTFNLHYKGRVGNNHFS